MRGGHSGPVPIWFSQRLGFRVWNEGSIPSRATNSPNMYNHQIQVVAHPGETIHVKDPRCKDPDFEPAVVLEVSSQFVGGRFEVTYLVKKPTNFGESIKRIRVHESLVKMS